MPIQHTVVFRLIHAPGSAAEQKFFADARTALGGIPGVADFEIARQVSAKSDLTHRFSMAFVDESAYRTYDEHPVHVAFVAERWTREVAQFQEYDYIVL